MTVDLGVDGIIVNGGGILGHRIDVTDMDNAGAFILTALNAAGAGGVHIQILPGSQSYRIEQVAGNVGLLLNGGFAPANNVTIEIMPGAVLEPKDTGVKHLIACTGKRLRIIGGGALTWPAGISVTGSSLVLLSGGSSNAIDNCLFRDIEWTLNTAADDAKALRANAASAAARSDGLRVDGCTFRGSFNSAFDDNTWIYAQHVFGVDITGNLFLPVVGELAANIKDAIQLENCPRSTIRGNRFTDLKGRRLIYLSTVSAQEGGHSLIFGNTSESSYDLTHLVYIEGQDFVSVVGNGFDRHSDLQAAIFATAKQNGTQGRQLLISNNEFHVFDATAGGTDRIAIHMHDWDGANIQGNLFFNMHDDGTFCRVEAACRRIKFNPNTNVVLGSEVATARAHDWWKLRVVDPISMLRGTLYGAGIVPLGGYRREPTNPRSIDTKDTY